MARDRRLDSDIATLRQTARPTPVRPTVRDRRSDAGMDKDSAREDNTPATVPGPIQGRLPMEADPPQRRQVSPRRRPV